MRVKFNTSVRSTRTDGIRLYDRGNTYDVPKKDALLWIKEGTAERPKPESNAAALAGAPRQATTGQPQRRKATQTA